MFTDIFISMFAIITFFTIINDIWNNFITFFEMCFINCCSNFFDHSTIFMSTDSWITVITISIKISDIICTDSRCFDTNQYFIIFDPWFIDFLSFYSQFFRAHHGHIQQNIRLGISGGDRHPVGCDHRL